jgi:hypothetical protein
MECRGNQCVWSIDPRCGCAHEKEWWVTRFTVIHHSFDGVEPLTDVVYQVGQRRDSRVILELFTCSQRPRVACGGFTGSGIRANPQGHGRHRDQRTAEWQAIHAVRVPPRTLARAPGRRRGAPGMWLVRCDQGDTGAAAP